MISFVKLLAENGLHCWIASFAPGTSYFTYLHVYMPSNRDMEAAKHRKQ